MYVKINVQPGEAFDRLAILEVKMIHVTQEVKENIREQIEELQGAINTSITHKKAKEIYFSKYYNNLFDANFDIFTGINDLRAGKKDHGKLQQINDLRFQRKKELQEKFFSATLSGLWKK